MVCESCGGAGTVDRDGRTYECECSLWTRIGASMPPYILSARFLPQHLTSPLIGCASRSCFVTGAWIDVRAIIKAVMMKHHGRFIRITSDREIRDVFVGSKSRQNSDEDSKNVYNSVEDLMGGGDPKGRPKLGPDLVVVRLNELAYKNKAAAGALEEALVCRLDYGHPTWVLSDVDKPFTSGSYAFSESVWDLLTTSFAQVRVPRISPRTEAQSALASEAGPREPRPGPPEASSGPPSGPDPPGPARREKVREGPRERPRAIRPVPDDDAPAGLGLYGSGVKKSGGFGQKKPFGRGD